MLALALSACTLVSDAEHDDRLDPDGDGVPFPADCAPRNGDVVVRTFYADADADGWGDETQTTEACAAPIGFVTQAGDCDDRDKRVNPDAQEACDDSQTDEDCDGLFDDKDDDEPLGAIVAHVDADFDGFGDPDTTVVACVLQTGQTTAALATDCNDDDISINPDATEICGNGVDDDCDGGPAGCTPVGTGPAGDFSTSELLGTADLERVGTVVYGGGDIDGDGSLDLVVGNPQWDDDRGRVYVLRSPIGTGVVDLDLTDVVLTGGSVDDHVGTDVDAIDLDDDGIEDLLVVLTRDNGIGAGAASVFGFKGPLVAGTTLDDAGFDLRVGAGGPIRAMEALHFDDDDFGDFVAGSSEFGFSPGRAFIVTGPITTPGPILMRNVPGVIEVEGPSAGAIFGETLANLGDVDSDGLDDILFGAPYVTGGGRNFLVAGGIAPGFVDIKDVDTAVLVGSGADHIGYDLASVGDVDGNGTPDILLSGDPEAGRAYLALTPATGTVALPVDAEATFVAANVGFQDGDQLDRVAGGDIDGDGTADLVFGARRADEGGIDAGTVYVFYGPVSGQQDLVDADAILTGQASDNLGADVVVPGDVNGDGFDDLLIGAPNADPPGVTDGGVVWLVLGGAL